MAREAEGFPEADALVSLSACRTVKANCSFSGLNSLLFALRTRLLLFLLLTGGCLTEQARGRGEVIPRRLQPGECPASFVPGKGNTSGFGGRAYMKIRTALQIRCQSVKIKLKSRLENHKIAAGIEQFHHGCSYQLVHAHGRCRRR